MRPPPDRRRSPGEVITPHQGPGVDSTTDTLSVHGQAADVADPQLRGASLPPPGCCIEPGCTTPVPPWWRSRCNDHYAQRSAPCAGDDCHSGMKQRPGRSLHPSGLCYRCRTRRLAGYAAQLAATVRRLLKREGHDVSPGPYEFFSQATVWHPCPVCGEPTVVGIAGQSEPFSLPTPCTRCRGSVVTALHTAAANTASWPLSEQGPCARCRKPCRRYGGHGNPFCGGCQAGGMR